MFDPADNSWATRKSLEAMDWPESLQPPDVEPEDENAPIDAGPSAASLWIMLAGLVITTALVGVLTWRSR